MSLIRISRRLARATDPLTFAPPVACVYNPLIYARASHEQYIDRYGRGTRDVIFLGMNPGPWGMAQTGVPFGDIAMVRDWLGIEVNVGKPPCEHRKRPVDGFKCRRSEVSGTRLWGWARDRFGPPEKFFERFFVWNYCPLSFMLESGANLTPEKLPASEREPLFDACDDALRALVKHMNPKWIVGVGKFGEQRARHALNGRVPNIGCVLHPSPASPAANRGWAEQAEAQLHAMGIRL